MALQKRILENAYRKFFEEVYVAEEHFSYSEAAERLLRPYDEYAKTGTDPSGDVLISGKVSVAKKILFSGYRANRGEEALKNALSTYWMGASFNIVVPHATMSQEVSAIVTSVDTSKLNGVFDNDYKTVDEAVDNLVSKLDAFTKTVTILITGLAKAGSPPPTITATGKLS